MHTAASSNLFILLTCGYVWAQNSLISRCAVQSQACGYVMRMSLLDAFFVHSSIVKMQWIQRSSTSLSYI